MKYRAKMPPRLSHRLPNVREQALLVVLVGLVLTILSPSFLLATSAEDSDVTATSEVAIMTIDRRFEKPILEAYQVLQELDQYETLYIQVQSCAYVTAEFVVVVVVVAAQESLIRHVLRSFSRSDLLHQTVGVVIKATTVVVATITTIRIINNKNNQQQQRAGSDNYDKNLSNYQKADGWYLASQPRHGANVAYALYGIPKSSAGSRGNLFRSSRRSPCSKKHYLTTFVTTGGIESLTNVLATLGIENFVYQNQNAGNNNNNNNQNHDQAEGMMVSSACAAANNFQMNYDNYYNENQYYGQNNNNNNNGGQYGVYQFTVEGGYTSYAAACVNDEFVMAKFTGAMCWGTNFESVTDNLKTFNKALHQAGCVAIYDSSQAISNDNGNDVNNNQDNNNRQGQANNNQYQRQQLPIEMLLGSSENCLYQDVCPTSSHLLEDSSRAFASFKEDFGRFSQKYELLRRSAWASLVGGIASILTALYLLVREIITRRKLKKKWKRHSRELRQIGSDFTDFDLPYVEKTSLAAAIEMAAQSPNMETTTPSNVSSAFGASGDEYDERGLETNTSHDAGQPSGGTSLTTAETLQGAYNGIASLSSVCGSCVGGNNDTPAQIPTEDTKTTQDLMQHETPNNLQDNPGSNEHSDVDSVSYAEDNKVATITRVADLIPTATTSIKDPSSRHVHPVGSHVPSHTSNNATTRVADLLDTFTFPNSSSHSAIKTGGDIQPGIESDSRNLHGKALWRDKKLGKNDLTGSELSEIAPRGPFVMKDRLPTDRRPSDSLRQSESLTGIYSQEVALSVEDEVKFSGLRNATTFPQTEKQKKNTGRFFFGRFSRKNHGQSS